MNRTNVMREGVERRLAKMKVDLTSAPAHDHTAPHMSKIAKTPLRTALVIGTTIAEAQRFAADYDFREFVPEEVWPTGEALDTTFTNTDRATWDKREFDFVIITPEAEPKLAVASALTRAKDTGYVLCGGSKAYIRPPKVADGQPRLVFDDPMRSLLADTPERRAEAVKWFKGFVGDVPLPVGVWVHVADQPRVPNYKVREVDGNFRRLTIDGKDVWLHHATLRRADVQVFEIGDRVRWGHKEPFVVVGKRVAKFDGTGVPDIEYAVRLAGTHARAFDGITHGQLEKLPGEVSWYVIHNPWLLEGERKFKGSIVPTCYIEVAATNEEGIHTGRRRWHVRCREHGLIHPATTGPVWNAEQHLLAVSRGERIVEHHEASRVKPSPASIERMVVGEEVMIKHAVEVSLPEDSELGRLRAENERLSKRLAARQHPEQKRLRLWAHIVSEHANAIWPWSMTMEEMLAYHKHEHEGTGTIRNHLETERHASVARIREVLEESDEFVDHDRLSTELRCASDRADSLERQLADTKKRINSAKAEIAASFIKEKKRLTADLADKERQLTRLSETVTANAVSYAELVAKSEKLHLDLQFANDKIEELRKKNDTLCRVNDAGKGQVDALRRERNRLRACLRELHNGGGLGLGVHARIVAALTGKGENMEHIIEAWEKDDAEPLAQDRTLRGSADPAYNCPTCKPAVCSCYPGHGAG